MSYYVYILCSQRNGTLYIGVTNDIVRRIYEHKAKMVKGFTKNMRLIKLRIWKRMKMWTMQFTEKNV